MPDCVVFSVLAREARTTVNDKTSIIRNGFNVRVYVAGICVIGASIALTSIGCSGSKSPDSESGNEAQIGQEAPAPRGNAALAEQPLDDAEPTSPTSITTRRHDPTYVEKEKIERYPNGKPRRGFEARYYPNGEITFHGRYVEFWDTGKKHSQGRYVEGKKDGEWIYWHANGVIAKKGSFVNGKLEGPWFYLNEHGRPKFRFHYKDGLRDGELTVFDKDEGKRVVRKVHFKQGKRHGTSIEYYVNGNVMQSSEWADDVEHGKKETFSDKGQRLMLEHYRHGKLHGSSIRWSPSGEIEKDVEYVDGVRQLN